MGMKSFSNFLTLLLALAGCIVAIVLTVEEFSPSADIGCSKLGGDCSQTVHSKYGHLGPIPTSLFGLGMYLTLGGLCVLRHNKLRARREAEKMRAENYANPTEPATDEGDEQSDPVAPPDTTLALRTDIKRLEGILWGISLLGVGISWWLQYTSLWVLQAFCPWCLTSAILITLIFLVASYDFLIEGRKLDGEQKLLAGVASFILLCFAVIFTPMVVDKIKINIQAKTGDTPHPVSFDKRKSLVPDYLKFKGDPKAQYTLIEFADYQCPHCKEASAMVDELMKHSTPPKPLRFGFRNFPLEPHKWAREAALAAEAAGEQGKFWEMHDLIFRHQKDMESLDFSSDRFDDFARELKLDLTRFKKDRESDRLIERVAHDHVVGEEVEVEVTPTFYLITPTRVTLIKGDKQLPIVWNNPKDDAWK